MMEANVRTWRVAARARLKQQRLELSATDRRFLTEAITRNLDRVFERLTCKTLGVGVETCMWVAASSGSFIAIAPFLADHQLEHRPSESMRQLWAHPLVSGHSANASDHDLIHDLRDAVRGPRQRATWHSAHRPRRASSTPRPSIDRERVTWDRGAFHAARTQALLLI